MYLDISKTFILILDMRVYVIIFPWTSLSGVKLTSTFLSVRYNMPDPAVSCLAVRLKSWGQVCKPWWCSRTSYLGLCCWGGFCACFYLLSRLPILQNLFLGVHLLVSLQNIAHMVPWQAEDFLACLNVNLPVTSIPTSIRVISGRGCEGVLRLTPHSLALISPVPRW